MNPNSRQLAMRDRAMASLMGIIALNGSNFGAESTFGNEFMGDGGAFGDDFSSDYGAEFGDEYGAEFGDEYGAEFGAAAVQVRRPTPAAAAALWKARQAAMSRTANRARIIEPNKGSSVKVEKYSFTLSHAITLGTAVTFTNFSGQPDTTIRPQRVTMNAPAPMFAFINDIKVANVSVIVGGGSEDAFNYNALGVGQSLDMPTLSPANRATITGSYTGFTPPGYAGGTATFFTASFKGPATIVA